MSEILDLNFTVVLKIKNDCGPGLRALKIYNV